MSWEGWSTEFENLFFRKNSRCWSFKAGSRLDIMFQITSEKRKKKNKIFSSNNKIINLKFEEENNTLTGNDSIFVW